MCGIADAEQTVGVPLVKMIDLNGEELDLVEKCELVDASMAEIVRHAKEGNEVCETLLECLEASGLNPCEITFAYEEGNLEVVVTVNQHGSITPVEVAKCVLRVVGATREAKPENVDWNTAFDDVEVSGGNGGGMAAIAPDRERSVNLDEAIGCVGLNADDLRVGIDEAGDFVLHAQMKGGKLGGFGGEEIKKVPLRHERDKFGDGGRWVKSGNG